MANLVVARTQQQRLFEKGFVGVPSVVKWLLGRLATQSQLPHHCQKQTFQFSYGLGAVDVIPPPQAPFFY